jgi:hypothetical protein
MEFKDFFLIILAFLGWSWGIVQYFINRKLQRKDKLIERRFLAYSNYMKKSDELMKSLRDDPSMIYGITNDFLKKILTEDESQIDDALLLFNEKLFDFAKKATEPLLILNQELQSLLLVCSNELIPFIEQYRLLASDFNNEFQNILSSISFNEPKVLQEELTTMGHNNRWKQFELLNNKILQLMRKEIGSD